MTHINLQYTTLTTPVPDFIYCGLSEYVRDSNSYKPQPEALIKKLAQKHDLPRNMIYLTAGADEAIQMFALAFGTHVHIFPPTYVVYAESKNFHATIHATNALVENQYTIPTDLIPNASMIFLANPNNPFGITSRDHILKLIENNQHAMIVIDEVYGEFRPDLSIVDEVKNYSHVAVLRSFSKAYGMAGIRLGYIIAPREIIKQVQSKTQWSNVSYLSVGAAMTALDHEEYFKELIQTISSIRKQFSKALNEKGYNLIDSSINAVSIKFDTIKQAQEFVDYFATQNIIVSHGNGWSNIGLDKSFVRIAIGTEKEMLIVTDVIKTIGE